MPQWKLSGSRGWNQINGRFICEWSDQNNSNVILVAVSLSGMFWERSKEISQADLIPDYSVELPQILFQRQRIELLIGELERWLHSPKGFSVELCGSKGNDQSLQISIGVIPGLISSLEKPACTISYSGTAFCRGEWSFIVDQSCMRGFLEELRVSLGSLVP